jgi:hypothetical protein
MADKVDIGAFFNVKHMRLIERVTGVGRVVGRIGGPDRLIYKLNANNPNEELDQLLRCDALFFLLFSGAVDPRHATDEENEGKKTRRQQWHHEPRVSPRLPAFLKATKPQRSSRFVPELSGHFPCS